MGINPEIGAVTLTGRLICTDAAQATRVHAALAEHTALTRAEAGCLSFNVYPTGDPLVWQVEERFRDTDAFKAHQARAAASDWGRQTAGITRDYVITGMS